jgi:uncharacterized RDD family membrane protein YckC
MVRRRLVSWWWDYVVVVAWLLIVFALVGVPVLRGWIDLPPVRPRPVVADVAVTLLTVVPFLLYLVATEAGHRHATWGKRRSALAVRAIDGSPAASRRVFVRNVVKVLPWQFGHLAAVRFAGGDVSAAAIVFDVLSVGLLALVAGPPFARRGVHDWLAGTTVAPAAEPSGRR